MTDHNDLISLPCTSLNSRGLQVNSFKKNFSPTIFFLTSSSLLPKNLPTKIVLPEKFISLLTYIAYKLTLVFLRNNVKKMSYPENCSCGYCS